MVSRFKAAVLLAALLAARTAAEEPPDDLDQILAQLTKGSAAARVRAARELGRLGGGRAKTALLAALDDRDPQLRHEVAVVLARLEAGHRKVVDTLVVSLRSDDWYVRWQACLALKSVGPPARAAVPSLLQSLCDTEQDVCRESVLALAAIAPRDKEVVAALVDVLEAEHPVDLGATLFALELSGRGVRDAIPSLANILKDGPPGLHARARRCLAAAAPVPESVLDDLLDAPAPETRAFAARELAKRRVKPKTKPSIALHIPKLASRDKAVREAAKAALTKLGAEPLATMVSVGEVTVTRSANGREVTRNEWVAWIEPPGGKEGAQLLAILRDRAIGEPTLAALAELPFGVPGMVRLVAALERGEEIERECAAILIGRVARDKEWAKRALREALTDRSAEVRGVDERALHELGEGR
jgi:HEAT repeat protein